eukprot:36728-Eustigmatos_ZCMA.PRE.1
MDGSSLMVTWHPPLLDGGYDVDAYRVEYSTAAFNDEVQSVRIMVDSEPEVQVVSTWATRVYAVQLVHAKLRDNYAGE